MEGVGPRCRPCPALPAMAEAEPPPNMSKMQRIAWKKKQARGAALPSPPGSPQPPAPTAPPPVPASEAAPAPVPAPRPPPTAPLPGGVPEAVPPPAEGDKSLLGPATPKSAPSPAGAGESPPSALPPPPTPPAAGPGAADEARAEVRAEVRAEADAAAGCQLHVRGVGGDFEDERALSKVFLRFGEVIQATVRHRVDESGANTSWALVTMGSVAAVEEAISAAESLPKPLTVARFSRNRAASSKGAMGTIRRQAAAKQIQARWRQRAAWKQTMLMTMMDFDGDWDEATTDTPGDEGCVQETETGAAADPILARKAATIEVQLREPVEQPQLSLSAYEQLLAEARRNVGESRVGGAVRDRDEQAASADRVLRQALYSVISPRSSLGPASSASFTPAPASRRGLTPTAPTPRGSSSTLGFPHPDRARESSPVAGQGRRTSSSIPLDVTSRLCSTVVGTTARAASPRQTPRLARPLSALSPLSAPLATSSRSSAPLSPAAAFSPRLSASVPAPRVTGSSGTLVHGRYDWRKAKAARQVTGLSSRPTSSRPAATSSPATPTRRR